jgi:hypothetical protein
MLVQITGSEFQYFLDSPIFIWQVQTSISGVKEAPEGHREIHEKPRRVLERRITAYKCYVRDTYDWHPVRGGIPIAHRIKTLCLSSPLIHHQDAPSTHCHSNSTQQYYSMLDGHCKYSRNPCQQSEEPLLGSYLEYNSVSLEEYAGKLQLSLPQPGPWISINMTDC